MYAPVYWLVDGHYCEMVFYKWAGLWGVETEIRAASDMRRTHRLLRLRNSVPAASGEERYRETRY